MAKTLVKFRVGVKLDLVQERNEVIESYTISSIEKETKATYTLKDIASNSSFYIPEHEHKMKKSEIELDVLMFRSYDRSPSDVFMYKVMDEALITDDFITATILDMKKKLADKLNEFLQYVNERTQKKIDLLN